MESPPYSDPTAIVQLMIELGGSSKEAAKVLCCVEHENTKRFVAALEAQTERQQAQLDAQHRRWLVEAERAAERELQERLSWERRQDEGVAGQGCAPPLAGAPLHTRLLQVE